MKKIRLRYLLLIVAILACIAGCSSGKTISRDEAYDLWKNRVETSSDDSFTWNHMILNFNDGMGGNRWNIEVFRTDEGFYGSNDFEKYKKMKDSDAESLNKLFKEYDIFSLFNYENEELILDAGTYTMQFDFNDGTMLTDSGYMDDIKNTFEFQKKLSDLFDLGINR